MAPQDAKPSTDNEYLSKSASRFATVYSDSAEKVHEITKLLRQCGIERVVPPLPKIAVIGNQSAGKSSLIEAISKINIPRSKGTTTRCPMEVNLRSSHTNGWSCTIKARFEDPNVTTGRPPGTVDLATVTSPEEVSLFIRRAQLAILNPTKDPKFFLELDEAECQKYPSEMLFSKNMVVVEISKADVDVTFIDLPGIIANESKDDRCIVSIENLAISYAEQEQCLILVTVSMEEDLECQRALKIAKDCDPNGSRTIVALTKVDRVQPGHWEFWLNILRTEAGRYFVTRLHEPDIEGQVPKTWDQDREAEDKIFNNQPWCKADRSYLGSQKLTLSLSKRLAQMIKKRLPTLADEIESAQRQVEENLQSLPESFAENPHGKLLNLITNFTARVKEYTTGHESSRELFEGFYNQFERLENDILSTRLHFQIPPRPTQAQKQDSPLGIDYPFTSAAHADYYSPPESEPLARKEGPVEAEAKHEPKRPVITLQDVREMIKKKSRGYLPGHYDYAVLKELIGLYVSKWAPICLHAFQAVELLLKGQMEALCCEFFNRFESSGFLGEVKTAVFEVVRSVADRTRNHINLICDLETNKPFTLSYKRFKTTREETRTDSAYRRSQYPSAKAVTRTSHTLRDGTGNYQSISQDGIADDVLIGHLCARGYPITDPKQLAVLHQSDEYDTELNVIADVQAYFETSSNRVIDYMPMIFEVVFARDFGTELANVLRTKLKLDDSAGVEKCHMVTQDAEDIQIKRTKLTEDKAILAQALQILTAF